MWVLAALLTKLILRRPQADAAAIAMGSTFGNTVMLGIALAISAAHNAADNNVDPCRALCKMSQIVEWLKPRHVVGNVSNGG